MKFVERSGGLYLEDITKDNIRFLNLAGRMTGSVYDDPDRPSHVLVFWITDEECLAALSELGVRIKQITNEETNEVRYSAQFKAYPKMRINRVTGKEEQYPKVMMKTTANTVRLAAGAFGLVDSSHISEMSIRFHLWQYDSRKPDVVAVLDEIWVLADEGAGEIDEGYLDEKYGYEPEPFDLDE